VARQIARSLGGSPVRIPGGKKVLYHAAATMAASNVLAVEEAASQLLMSVGMKRRQATGALLTLTRQVLENMEQLGPRAAWTGPLAREISKSWKRIWKRCESRRMSLRERSRR